MTYYCKNCNNIVGKWNKKIKNFIGYNFCDYFDGNFETILFVNCKNCNNFVGLKCNEVCKYCFGKKILIEEKILKKWFYKYKKTIDKNIYSCKICNKKNFRHQYWFFEELTFYK